MRLTGRERSLTISSAVLDTIHERDRRTDGRQQRPRLRVASRGKNANCNCNIDSSSDWNNTVCRQVARRMLLTLQCMSVCLSLCISLCVCTWSGLFVLIRSTLLSHTHVICYFLSVLPSLSLSLFCTCRFLLWRHINPFIFLTVVYATPPNIIIACNPCFSQKTTFLTITSAKVDHIFSFISPNHGSTINKRNKKEYKKK